MTTEHEYVAYVGIDWADQKHQVCLRPGQSDRDEQAEVSSKPLELHAWAHGLRRRFGGGRIAVAVEATKGPLIYALGMHEHMVIFPVAPSMLKKYREARRNSGAKNDPLDAAVACELVRMHRDWLRPLPTVTAPLRELQLLLEARRGLVDQRSGLVNQVTAALKAYFPQARELTGNDPTSAMAAAFLRRWPTLAAVQRSRPNTLRAFYREHGMRSAELIEQRVQLVAGAVSLTNDAAVLAAMPMLIEVLLRQIEVLQTAIAGYDQRIGALFTTQPDHTLFASLPGAGSQIAPRLLVAFGVDRARYGSAQQLQQYSGIAPVQEQSGKTRVTRWRWHAPTFLRQTFHEFAGCSIPYNAWAKAYYEQQIARGKKHHQAVRALAYKWQRVLFRCWKDGVPYDECRYLAALRKHGSPLIATLDASTAQAA